MLPPNDIDQHRAYLEHRLKELQAARERIKNIAFVAWCFLAIIALISVIYALTR